MRLSRLQRVKAFAKAGVSMIELAWQAAPHSFVGLVLIELVQGVIPLLSAWLTKLLFDQLALGIAQPDATMLPTDLLLLLAGLAGLSTASYVLPQLHGYLNADLGRHVTFNVQSIVYRKISGFVGLRYFEDPQFHDTIQLATRGAQSGPLQALGACMTTLRSGVTLMTFVGALLVLNPLLVLIVVVAVVPQIYIQRKVGQQRFSLAVGNSPKEREIAYYGYLLSGLHAAKEIRLFNLSEHFLAHFQRMLQNLHQAARRQHTRELRWQSALSVLVNLVAAGAFVVVVLQAVAGRLSLGDVMLYTSAVASVQTALAGLVGVFAMLNEGVLFYSQFMQLVGLPQPVRNSDTPLPLPPLESIELRDVSFRYSEHHPWVLRQLNLRITRGTCVALVGVNGAGKTTLVKLLTRLYDPTEGQILWNGVDISAFDPAELRQRMSAIFQDFTRYEVSMYDNIALGAVNRIGQPTRVQQAAAQAGIDQTIAQLPNGYQTVLSRWLATDTPGVELSGGQWQRVAIARMFMRDAEFLLLDEPTAALDAQAENDLYQHLGTLVSSHTSLLITHRFSIVRLAHQVAVLEQGRITEYGTHEQLIQRRGTYATLYGLQAAHYQRPLTEEHAPAATLGYVQERSVCAD